MNITSFIFSQPFTSKLFVPNSYSYESNPSERLKQLGCAHNSEKLRNCNIIEFNSTCSNISCGHDVELAGVCCSSKIEKGGESVTVRHRSVPQESM